VKFLTAAWHALVLFGALAVMVASLVLVACFDRIVGWIVP
jgi:hypothetical protein